VENVENQGIRDSQGIDEVKVGRIVLVWIIVDKKCYVK